MKIIGADWLDFFYPAIHLFLSGQNPYTNPGIANPPWTFLILAPLAFLPPFLSVAAINFTSIAAIATFFYRKKKKWLALFLAASYPFLVLLGLGNIDALLVWGLIIGGPIGLIFLMAKPQASLFLAAVWVIQAWKKGGWKEVAILVSPLLLLTLISVLIYPDWPRNLLTFSLSPGPNDQTNGFPWMVPLGLGLLIIALRNEREDLAAVATLLIMPYVRVQSWIVPLCLLAAYYPLEGAVVALSTWLVYLKLYFPLSR